MSSYSILQLSSILEDILGPEIEILVKEIQSTDSMIKLPSNSDVDLVPTEVTRLIAFTSNKYALACRLAGIARAQFKLAEGKYKLKFRTSLSSGGKNKEEREAKALDFAKEEYEKMILLEAVVALAESVESSCRIASESSRRMLLGADQYTKAVNREEPYRHHTSDQSSHDF